MEIMKTVSIRELHMHTGALVQEAADGEVIIIQKRGVDVAELGPLPEAAVLRKKPRKANSKIDR